MEKNIFSLLFITLFSNILFSQNDDNTKDQISNLFKNYFLEDRESIHIHINKEHYFNYETIWFTGYIKNRQSGFLFNQTTNVYAILYSENGTSLDEKLLFANNGIISGNFKLKENYESGYYYIHLYTNWMNNFLEDESLIRKVEIINPSQGEVYQKKEANLDNSKIVINPESSVFLEEVENIVGISFKDCSGFPIPFCEGTLTNSKNEIISKIKTNRFGETKILFKPNNETFKIQFTHSEKTFTELLPIPNKKGISLEINNYTIKDKIIVKIKTNSATEKEINNKKKYLVANQDDKVYFFDLHITENKLNEEFILSTENFPDGIINFRVIDSDLNQWCERVIYNLPKNIINSEISLINNNSNIDLNAKSDSQNTKISISALAIDNDEIDSNNSIVATFTANCFTKKPLDKLNYFLENTNRVKLFDLDLSLLNNDLIKYNWNDIKKKSLVIKHNFEKGIKIKGTINTTIKEPKKHKARLYSAKDLILLTTDVDENNQFEFDNIILADSAKVELSILKMPDLKPIDAKITAQFINSKKNFKHKFTGKNDYCNEQKILIKLNEDEIPKLADNIINLDEITIKNSKNSLKHENKLSNSFLKGYKIDASYAYNDVLLFIESKGFKVDRSGVNIRISSRNLTSFAGNTTTPVVYIDERLLFALDELNFIRMEDIDEIYVDRRAIIGGFNNNEGIIKIYLKKSFYEKNDNNSNFFYVKNGFEKFKRFKNLDYSNYKNKGFKKYGVIGWGALINFNDENSTSLNFDSFYLKKYKIVIDGISTEGKLLHYEKIFEAK